jgi:hypothetical protein
MSTAHQNLSWLHWREMPFDEGTNTAHYPYAHLNEIRSIEEARAAVLDETGAIENEFGKTVLGGFYELIWRLNTAAGVFASHTAVAPKGYHPPYEWARHYIAAQILILSREAYHHYDLDACKDLTRELGRVVSASTAFSADTSGWYAQLGIVNMTFIVTAKVAGSTCENDLRELSGFGCSLIVGGAASSRRVAAERLNRAAGSIARILRDAQEAP